MYIKTKAEIWSLVFGEDSLSCEREFQGDYDNNDVAVVRK